MRVSEQQKGMMLDFMIQHRELLCNEPKGTKRREKLWQELGSKLNSCAIGATLEVGKWAKFWEDWNYEVKMKAANLRGPPLRIAPLSQIQQRVLNFIEKEDVTEVEGTVAPADLQLDLHSPAVVEVYPLEASMSTPLCELHETPSATMQPRKRRCIQEDDNLLEVRCVRASEKMAESAASMAASVAQMSGIMGEILVELRRYLRK